MDRARGLDAHHCRCLLLAVPVRADDWTDALNAFDAENYDMASALMTPIADAGDVRAQSQLRHMYAYGEGTPVNFERLEHYARLAAEQGNRAGSVCLNSYWGFAKWIVCRFMPLPGLASAH